MIALKRDGYLMTTDNTDIHQEMAQKGDANMMVAEANKLGTLNRSTAKRQLSKLQLFRVTYIQDRVAVERLSCWFSGLK